MAGKLTHGDLFERHFEIGDHVIEMLAEISIEGRALHLKDVAIYPRGIASTQVGTEGVLAMRAQLKQVARSAGFELLRITGVRLDRGKPKKQVDVIISLQREL